MSMRGPVASRASRKNVGVPVSSKRRMPCHDSSWLEIVAVR